MKKILMVIAAVAVLQTAVYAQSIDFSGDVTGGKSVEVTNLENGYYDLTAVCKNTSEEGVSYLYGVSDGYTAASTVLPVSADGVKVTVRGIEVENGKCTIGVGTDGNGVIEVSDVDLVKTDTQNGFIQGGDMTEVDYIESLGGEYKDSDGNKVDPFEFLSQNGMNMVDLKCSFPEHSSIFRTSNARFIDMADHSVAVHLLRGQRPLFLWQGGLEETLSRSGNERKRIKYDFIHHTHT